MDNGHIIPDSDEEVNLSEELFEEDLTFITEATDGSPPNKKQCLDDKKNDPDKENLAPGILKAAQKVKNCLIPEKSVVKYQNVYKHFMNWVIENNNGSKKLNETLLLAYFGILKDKYVPSTLWATYSMLKSTLIAYDNINIYKYSQLINFLKQNGKRHEPKKSKELTEEQCRQFITFAPDDQYLPLKVALIFGLNGACRRHELHEMTLKRLQDFGNYYHVSWPKSQVKNCKDRSFSIVQPLYRIVKKYIDSRPSGCQLNDIFLTFRDGKCINQPMGINTLGSVPKKIAEFLRLPDANSYTGHALRRTSATIFANAGGTVLGLKELGGWNSDKIAESYTGKSL